MTVCKRKPGSQMSKRKSDVQESGVQVKPSQLEARPSGSWCGSALVSLDHTGVLLAMLPCC